jgi:hypothetical protein
MLVLPLAIALALLAYAVQTSRAEGAPIYWGAYIDGGTYGFGDAPFDARSIDAFESHAGKRVSIVHWGQPWYWGSQGGYQPFRRDLAARVRARGSIPMINWNSWDLDKGGSLDQPDFQLLDIINGAHDAYIRQWARDAKAWGFPLFVRFDHEMNGDWFPWSERENGNGPGQYARMWRHVVDIFNQEGATNVTWVWAPNRLYADALPLDSLYPGDKYVDWTGISGYNWGTNPSEPGNVWQSFTEVQRATYDALRTLAPSKPIMIAETASSEVGGSKAAWITDALQAQLPVSWPQVKAVLWFNWNTEVSNGLMDWVIESSPSAQAAFSAGIASPYYASNTFGSLPALTKVVPIGEAPAPGPGGTPAPGSPGAGGAAKGARILSLAVMPRCRPGRPVCLRLVWRAGAPPPARVRFWIRVREVSGRATVARRVGTAAAGRRHAVVLTSGRRPHCGRVVARLTVRAAGATSVRVRRAVIRQSCIRPPRRAP